MDLKQFWAVDQNRGFLPSVDPDEMKIRTDSNSFILSQLECLAQDMPYYMEKGTAREELVACLRNLYAEGFDAYIDMFERFNAKQLERLNMLFSYFASFYIHATGMSQAKILPKEIAIPLFCLNNLLKREPILCYANYCLTNWRRIDKSKPIELGNIELLQHFKNGVGEVDESWFILVHVDIEAKAGPAIKAINDYCQNSVNQNLKSTLSTILNSLININVTMNRMEEHCSTELYFDKVRPYIFGFNNVVYENVSEEPVTHRGETGAQSSVVPAFITFLGIEHKQSMLTKHLDDMRKYMPQQHRDFLFGLQYKLQGDSSQPHLIRQAVLNNPDLHDLYNDCVKELVAFRKKHLEYAVNYIQKKVKDPSGTGGTPYIQWLSELIKETESHYISKV